MAKKPKYVKTADVPASGRSTWSAGAQQLMHARGGPPCRESDVAGGFRDRDGTDRVAVKNVRVHTYATAADDGRAAPGSQAHEAWNQKTPIEDL